MLAQPLHANLTALAGQTVTAAGLALLDDADAAAQLTTLGVSAFIKTVVDDPDAATARTTLGAAAAWFKPSYAIGDYIQTPVASLTASVNAVNGALWLTRVFVPADYTFNELTINVAVVAGTTGTARLGIYADANGRPTGAPILDAGTVSLLSTTGVKTKAISQALSAGTYWTAALTEFTGSTPALIGTAGAGLFFPVDTVGSTRSALSLGGQSGALPTSPAAGISGNVPIVWLRRSA